MLSGFVKQRIYGLIVVMYSRFSDLKRIHHEQKAIRDDISKLRKELSDTRKEVLQAVSDSESRTSELLHRILEELEECKTS